MDYTYYHKASKMIVPLTLLVFTNLLIVDGRPMFASVMQDTDLATFRQLMKRSVVPLHETAAMDIRMKRQAGPHGFPVTPEHVMIYIPQWMFLFKDLWENIVPYQPDMEHVEFAFENAEPGFNTDFDILGNNAVDHDMFPEIPDGFPEADDHSHSELLADAADTFAEANFNEDILSETREAVENFVTGEPPELPEGVEHEFIENAFEQPDIPEFTDAVTGDIDPLEAANDVHEHIENVVDQLLSPGEVEPVHVVESEVSDFLDEQFNVDDRSNSIINGNQNKVLQDESHFENAIEPHVGADAAHAMEEDGATFGSAEVYGSQINNDFETPATIKPSEAKANYFETSSDYSNVGDDIKGSLFDKENDLSDFFNRMFGVYGDMLADFRDSVAEMQEHNADINTEQTWDHLGNAVEGEHGIIRTIEGETTGQHAAEVPDDIDAVADVEASFSQNDVLSNNLNHLSESAEAEHLFEHSPTVGKHSADIDSNSRKENENTISHIRQEEDGRNNKESSVENENRNINIDHNELADSRKSVTALPFNQSQFGFK